MLIETPSQYSFLTFFFKQEQLATWAQVSRGAWINARTSPRGKPIIRRAAMEARRVFHHAATEQPELSAFYLQAMTTLNNLPEQHHVD